MLRYLALLMFAGLCVFFSTCNVLAATATAQDSAIENTTAVTDSSASTNEPAAESSNSTDRENNEATDEAAVESFDIARQQHPWLKFGIGAWRDMEIESESYADGKLISRSVTTQKESLHRISPDGKYVLGVKATVEVGGRRVEGEVKLRALLTAIDGAGPIVSTRRLEDQAVQIVGRSVNCQVWEVHYREGSHNLRDVVYYREETAPHILRRDTFTDNGLEGVEPELLNRMEVVATQVPYKLGDKIVATNKVSSLKYSSKGNTLRLSYNSDIVPGGELEIRTMDYDVEGELVRWSFSQLAAYGELTVDGPIVPETGSP